MFLYSSGSWNDIELLWIRAGEQIRQRGSIARENELWIERRIQGMKKSVRARTQKNPEAVIANQVTARLAIQSANLLLRPGAAPLRTFAQSEEARCDARMPRLKQDRGDSVTGTQLLGSWSETKAAQRAADMGVLGRLVGALDGGAQLLPADIGECRALRYQRAQLQSGEVVFSTAYLRETKSISYWVKVHYPDEGYFAAKVLYFLKVVRKPLAGEAEAQEDPAEAAAAEEYASEAPGGTLRLAVCDLYGPLTKTSNYAGDFWLALGRGRGRRDPPVPEQRHLAFPVELDTISRKFLWYDGTTQGACMIPENRGYMFYEYPQNIASDVIPE